MPRLYEPSWIALKNSDKSPKRIEIAAPRVFHRRIYKAIIKEKDMDVVYKLQLDDNAQRARLSKMVEGSKITIFLHLGLGLDDF